MTDLSKLHKLLDWTLETGSHDWPGPDGGTCINELAAVVAGFEYRSMECSKDFPPCFSISMGRLLMNLNDMLGNSDRQKLKRFVLRLPGSADSSEVDTARMNAINWGLRNILSRGTGRLWTFGQSDRQRHLSHLLRSFFPSDLIMSNYYPSGDRLSSLIASIACQVPDLFDEALDLVDKAFDIGNKASEIDTKLINERMAEAKSKSLAEAL